MTTTHVPGVLGRRARSQQLTTPSAPDRWVRPSRPGGLARRPPTVALETVRATDPMGPALALVAGLVYALGGWNGPLNRDLGVFMYGGQRFLEGETPYAGVFNSVGPLADMMPGIGIWLGRQAGLSDVHGARGFFLVLSAVCVWLLYVVTRDLLDSRVLAVAACASFLCFREFTELAGNGPREKTAMLVFLLAALVVAQRSRWWAFGVLTALAALTWQPAFLPLVVVGLGFAVVRRDVVRPVVAAVRVCVAGVATTAVFVAYFWSSGGLRWAVDGFLLINLTHTSQPSPITHSDYARRILSEGYGWSLVLVLVGLATVLTCLLPPVRRGLDLGSGFAAVGLGGASAVAWTLYALNGPPDLFVVLPFAAIGVATLVLAVSRPWARSGVAPSWRRSVPAAIVAVVLLSASAVQALSLRGAMLGLQQASATAILAAIPRDATVLSIAAPEALVLTGHRNPSSFQLFTMGFGWYVDEVWPRGLPGYADWIRTTKPELIAVGAGFEKPWLDEVLRAGYVRVGGAPYWFWYASVDLPPEQLEALRSAH